MTTTFLRAMVFAVTLGTMQAQSPFSPVSAAVSDHLTFHSPLPDFEATDLTGQTWNSADLRGKITLVSIWSTWCLPCRQEHPALQRFYDETRSMKDVQVLTFGLDDSRDRVRSYMQAGGFTFPVIVDSQLERKLFPMEGGLPKSWVIDREGRRSEPFEAWTFGRALLETQKLAQTR